MVNLKSASFVVIMLLQEGLTNIQPQKKAQVAFWREFDLNSPLMAKTLLLKRALNIKGKHF